VTSSPTTACPGWQEIDTAPDDGTPILVFHPAWDTMQIAMRYPEHRLWQEPNGDVLRAPPINWMPLPPAPNGSGENGHASQ
jgi:hypothetical protein